MNLFTALVALFAFVPTTEVAQKSPARAITQSIHIGSSIAMQVEIAAPRLPAAEFQKITADEKLIAALNEKHLADLGTLAAATPFRFGGEFFAAGNYRIGIALTEKSGIAMTLKGAKDGNSSCVALEATAGGVYVPQPTITFLNREPIEQFDLEVRFGDRRGVALIDFSSERIVLDMNNIAFRILNDAKSPDGAAKDVKKALRLARAANDMTGGKVPGILDTVALAWFANGDSKKALATQRQAVATLAADDPRRGAMEAHLKQFETANQN